MSDAESLQRVGDAEPTEECRRFTATKQAAMIKPNAVAQRGAATLAARWWSWAESAGGEAEPPEGPWTLSRSIAILGG